MFYKLTFLSLE